MEKHKCKLCLRKFANGRALGGHVRSHKMKLIQEISSEEEEEECIYSSRSSSSFTSSDGEFEDQDKKSSHHFVDHQERESESDSIFFQTQSKRFRRSRNSSAHQFYSNKESIFKQPICEKDRNSPVVQSPPLSSISETNQEEEIAYCLMMLSRDKWTKTEFSIENSESKSESEQEKNQFKDSGSKVKVIKSRSKGKYRCETCDKVFKSYQALGGHRASHKRVKLSSSENKFLSGNACTTTTTSTSSVIYEDQKLHKCPVCFKVFSSGQALGGHKRSHGSSANLKLSTGKALIDLNLPAPFDDEDDTSQVVEQFSAFSDDDFVKSH